MRRALTARPQVASAEYTLFGTQTPSVPVYNDATPATFGTRFYSSVAGNITGVRFYKGSSAGGNSHTVALYTATGTLLASKVTSGETASGWQTQRFDTPVAITANTTYCVAVYWPTGYFPYTANFFTNQYAAPPLYAPANSNGGNGRYYLGSGLNFPTSSYNENYYSDVLFVASAPPPQNIVDAHGALRVSGNDIVGQHGNPVFLMGMSLYWSIYGPQVYWTPGVVNWLVDDWKIHSIRAPMAVEQHWGPPDGDGWIYDRAGQLALMETVIDAAIAKGIYVLVDWHTGVAESYVSAAQDFFTYFGNKYGSRPNMIWEIYNEPGTGDWETIRNYALQVTPVIRQYSQNLIICGTPYGSGRVDWALSNPLPDGNTAYTRHVYANGQVDDGISSTTAALNGGLAVCCTEWGETGPDGGVGDPTLNFPESQRWINWCRDNGIGGMNKWSIAPSWIGATAVLNEGASTQGGWNPSTDLTESGVWIRNKIREMNG